MCTTEQTTDNRVDALAWTNHEPIAYNLSIFHYVLCSFFNGGEPTSPQSRVMIAFYFPLRINSNLCESRCEQRAHSSMAMGARATRNETTKWKKCSKLFAINFIWKIKIRFRRCDKRFGWFNRADWFIAVISRIERMASSPIALFASRLSCVS